MSARSAGPGPGGRLGHPRPSIACGDSRPQEPWRARQARTSGPSIVGTASRTREVSAVVVASSTAPASILTPARPLLGVAQRPWVRMRWR
jgi:hypothetical protein